MSGSVQIFPPGFRITGPTGAVESGARIRFFEAGTSTPKEVFSDEALTVSLGSVVYTRSDGLPVASQGSNTTVNVYIGPGLHKYDIVDADGATIIPAKDNVPGAVAILDSGTPAVTAPVVTITGTSNSIDATHNGKFVIGNTAGGNVTATLAAASVLGDGWHCRFKKSAAANTMTIALAGGSDLIDGASTAVLTEQYDETDVYCDGANFWLGGRRVPFGTNAEAIAATKTTVMVQPAALEATLAAKTTLAGLVKAGGLQLLTSGDASGATLDIPLTSYTAYRGIMISLHLLPATDGAELYCRFSTDGGANYDATGYNYAYGLSAEGGQFPKGSGSANQIEMAENVGSAATEGGDFVVMLIGQTATARWSKMFFHGYIIDSQATPVASYIGGGGSRETAQDTDAIRFLFSTGNITSGKYAVYGLA